MIFTGFRSNSYATVWSVERISDAMTKGRISISRKNRTTGQYEQDFGGFVSFAGTACASKALRLKERDRIKLGDVDVTNRYDKESGKSYTNFLIYSFEQDSPTPQPSEPETRDDFTPEPDTDNLPF